MAFCGLKAATKDIDIILTSQDDLNALLSEPITLPPELIVQTQTFIDENRQLGYTTKEEFVRDAIRFRLTWLKGDNQCLEIPHDQYEKLNEALREMDTPIRGAEQFINSQINELLGKYEEFKKSAIK